ncbi:hypothetical protein PPYR_04542 [Photinus pyralis]|uniref:Thioesterase domain-containing protein n=1 Tax=Photinus pyralis TaxID=7054 RepID=A0A5N4AYG0_PHOPY|nr:acyl-coenzyme A thioesterase 13-like [Photinus pyralis]KAB0802356.1 hypothetical protein PPYR_04542 [Photinus pyralis]
MLRLSRIFQRGIATVDIHNFFKNSCERYDRIFSKVNIVKIGNGACVAELKIEKEHTNPFDGLHGGMIASMVDTLTSYALLTHKAAEGVPSVSVDMHVSFLKGAKCGEEVVINAETIKCGKSMAFAECCITNKATGEVIAKGNHTKYLINLNRFTL